MDFLEFEKDFNRRKQLLKLPRDASAQAPVLKAIAVPYVWTFEFFIKFSDDMHIRLWEHYGKFAGLQASRRLHWAYHYGPIAPGQIGSDGTLAKGTCTDPLVLRIDTANIGLHLHVDAQEPHYRQAQIGGLNLSNVDSWRFIKDILKHRQSGKAVSEVFGFKVIK